MEPSGTRFGAIRLIIIIAFGVVLGLSIWSAIAATAARVEEDNRIANEAENKAKVAEVVRKTREEGDRQWKELKRREKIWNKIYDDAIEKRKGLTSSEFNDFSDTIKGFPEYQDRIKAVGKEAAIIEELPIARQRLAAMDKQLDSHKRLHESPTPEEFRLHSDLHFREFTLRDELEQIRLESTQAR
ncbi:MAG TPA: hypothetical protein VKX17_03575 [Planctomycetota bacterium]|nr:hypothetical protein [Planctomycetota bacterium]